MIARRPPTPVAPSQIAHLLSERVVGDAHRLECSVALNPDHHGRWQGLVEAHNVAKIDEAALGSSRATPQQGRPGGRQEGRRDRRQALGLLQ